MKTISLSSSIAFRIYLATYSASIIGKRKSNLVFNPLIIPVFIPQGAIRVVLILLYNNFNSILRQL